MISIFALTSLALATLQTVVTPVSAHGYVTFPPSRQARCRAGEIPNCGDVRYEPQSVEAPKGSFLCNGNGARFHELNDDTLFENHFLNVPSGVDTLIFEWTLTAPHRTTTWDYIAITDGDLFLDVFDSHNTTPPFIVTHEVHLRGITGRQTVLARWNIGDTINAFYSCVDLLIDNDLTASDAQLPVGMSFGMFKSIGR